MLPRNFRLSRQESRQELRRFKIFRLEPFVLRVTKTVVVANAKKPTRCAINVPFALVNKSSVKRTLATRQIRHGLMNILQELNLGYTCLLILDSPLGKLKGKDLESRLRALFGNASLLQGN